MPDMDAPENDVIEQEQSVDEVMPLAGGSADAEAAEHDVLEQRQAPVDAAGGGVSADIEAPENDALEQAQSVDGDEDEYR